MSNPSAISSGLLAASTTSLKASKTYLNGFIAISDGTNLATVTIYDNPSAGSGTVVGKAIVGSGGATVAVSFVNPIRCDTGLTVVVSGTGSGAVIYYDA